MANEQLRELDTLKTNFFSNVSHDLGTPMTVIKAAVDNMLDGIAGAVTEKQERYLNRIKANADRLSNMIRDLLDLSRIDRGQTDLLQLNLAKIMVRDVVGETVDDFRPMVEEKGVGLRFEGTDAYAMVDREKLVRIVVNLVGNAVKFTDEGEVSVSVKPDGRGFVQTIVKDTGKGLPKEELDKIFEPFHQVKGTMGGTGLGLPIVKQFVELHGGRVWAESAGQGTGCTVTFTLPEAKS
ncbi:MAG: HAMP domain-containing sensor histidine kinase [bacterium]|nr:HAMP domain-containing sensor histidine kinase [bacterium]